MFGVLEVILRRDPIPRQSFGAGQIQIALIVSLGALRTPGLGAGKPGRSSSPGLGCSRHCVGHAFAISAQLCRRWMTLRSVVHIGPYAARRKPRDVDWRNCRTAAQSAGAMPQGRRSNCDGCTRRLGAALDQKQRAGRTHPGRQSLYRIAKWRFQVAGWRPSPPAQRDTPATVALLIARRQSLHRHFGFSPRLIDRVAGNGDVRRIGARRLVDDSAGLRQGIQHNVKCRCCFRCLSVAGPV